MLKLTFRAEKDGSDCSPEGKSILSIEMNFDHDDVTHMDITEQYVNFLRGLGYVFAYNLSYDVAGMCTTPTGWEPRPLAEPCGYESSANGSSDRAPGNGCGDCPNRVQRW